VAPAATDLLGTVSAPTLEAEAEVPTKVHEDLEALAAAVMAFREHQEVLTTKALQTQVAVAVVASVALLLLLALVALVSLSFDTNFNRRNNGTLCKNKRWCCY
jgi:predicted alternative tryptophan synthase beta-subunit